MQQQELLVVDEQIRARNMHKDTLLWIVHETHSTLKACY
jgi:hypothetical protein